MRQVYKITVSIALAIPHKYAMLTVFSVRKPEKGEPFDAQVVAAVEAKLRAMDVDDDSPFSAAEAT
jgi:hypothetical protein